MCKDRLTTLVLLMTLVAVLSAFSLPAQARDNAQQTVNGASDKFLRGTVNVLTGWMEFPKNIVTCTAQTRSVTGPFRGIFRGLGMVLVRTGAGAIEMVSFVDPKPGHYDGILDPPTVFGPMKKTSPPPPAESQPQEEPQAAPEEQPAQPEQPQTQPQEAAPQKEMVQR